VVVSNESEVVENANFLLRSLYLLYEVPSWLYISKFSRLRAVSLRQHGSLVCFVRVSWPPVSFISVYVKPNTHRRRRRDETVELRRVGVGGVYINSQLAHDDCRDVTKAG